MERKIGEIFNYQDNWYQCIENLLWGLFLVVLSPASLIVIIIVELIDSGFFKKVYKLWN